MNELLTICIPTLNRAGFLRECLETFLPLVAPHQIPICVSDNGSSDNTLQMLEEFQRRTYPLLSFRANPDNRGIDQNMVDVIDMARTKYAWLFGDDDLPQPEAIDQVLGCLKKEPKLLVVNASTHNADFSRRVEERRIKLYEDQAYPPGDHNRLMVDTASYVTYLGGLVVDVEGWRSVDHGPLLRTDYLHVSVVFRYVVGQHAMLCANPLIKLRLQPPSWLSRYFEVEMINWPQTVWSLPPEHYSAASKSAVVGERPTTALHRIVAMRGYGHYNRATYDKFISRANGIGAWKKVVFLLIAQLPRAWFRIALVLFMRVRRMWDPSRYELALFRLRDSSRW